MTSINAYYVAGQGLERTVLGFLTTVATSSAIDGNIRVRKWPRDGEKWPVNDPLFHR